MSAVANGTYQWAIAQVGTGNATVISIGGGGSITGNSTTNLLSADPTLFALSTANLTVNGGNDSVDPTATPSLFALYFETVGGNNDLVLTYAAAPEPGTGLLVLAGALPMLTSRRRW